MNWLLFKNSLIVSAGAAMLATIFGFAAALSAYALGRRLRQLLLVLAVLSLALPPFLVTNSWLHFLGPAGVWRQWLPLSIFSIGGTTWILALLTWPIAFFAILAAWSRLETYQLEADPLITGWALIRHVLLPMAGPAALQAAILVLVLALNNFAVPAILQVKVFPAEAWVRFNTSFDAVGALKLIWPLVVVPLLLLVWLSRRQIEWPRLGGSVSAGLFRRRLGGRWFSAASIVTLSVCLLSVALPLFQLLSTKRTWTELSGALAAGQLAIWNSALFALSSATICLILCLVIAASRRHVDGRQRGSMATLLLWLPFLIPGVLLGIALIAVFNHAILSSFYNSVGIVILALLIRYCGPGWTTVSHVVASTEGDLEDAARLEGAGRWQMLRYVQWPQIGSQVSAIWYVLFLLCLWDVESMVLIIPPGRETMALRIFNLLHYGHNAQVNALCLTVLLMAVAPLLTYQAWRCLQVSAKRKRYRAAVCCGLLFLFTGCQPSSTGNEFPLNSKIFGSVQIIGTRGVGVGQLNKPRSVAVDAHDNLFVVDMTGRVQKFSPSGRFLLSWQMPQTDLGKPKGMCRDGQGNIIVVEPHYQRINHFTPEGKLVRQWGTRGTNTGQFILPRAAAVNSHNEVFVSEYSILERVQKFRFEAAGSSTSAPAFELAFGQSGQGPEDFNRPEGLCVDSHDNLYVADSCNHRIQIYSSDGKLLRSHGKAGTGPGELSYPYDICVDKEGRQYVCEFGNSRIQVFDANDRPIEIIGGPGGEPGQFSNPWGVALDSAGNLYVADSQNHRVQKLMRKTQVTENQDGGRGRLLKS